MAVKKTRVINHLVGKEWWDSLTDEVRAYKAAKRRCKKSGVIFKIEAEDIPPVPKVCPILQIPLFRGERVAGPNSPSLDRIDNRLGYVPGNVRFISYKANTLKGNMSLADIRRLYEYSIGQI